MGLLDKFIPKKKPYSFLRDIATGSLYRVSDMKGNSSFSDIKTQIDMMRALARDSQVSTALDFYATDATIANSNGDIIWATPKDAKNSEAAEAINACFKRWKINRYIRDHILELATVGNLYIPTTYLFKQSGNIGTRKEIGLSFNTIKDEKYDIVPSYKLQPDEVVHIWLQGEPKGFIYQQKDFTNSLSGSSIMLYPEESIIHFSMGGLLGEYTIEGQDESGNPIEYDIQFAQPLMDKASQPTQALSLLEDSLLLSSLIRVVKFINVEAGSEEDEIRETLQMIKDSIEQQFAFNTSTGDAQSFVNPQSPNNFIYLPKVNGSDAISVTDLNMSDANAEDSKLLDYYQNKKLSVLGVPKEAMNYSSNEGLGGAGSVLSQRSSLYANKLQRIETAYIDGWTDAFNKYFVSRGFSGFVDTFQLHMNPIVTQQSTLAFEKRDSAISQAASIVDLMKTLGVDNADSYKSALVELLTEVLPLTSSKVEKWGIHPEADEDGGNLDEF